MRTVKKNMLIVFLSCIGMLVAGINTAGAQNYWFFEIQVQGKGIQADSDGPNIPPYPDFAESKHKLDKTTCYAMYVRTERRFVLAYSNVDDGSWDSVEVDPVPETDKGVLPYLAGSIVHEETIEGHPRPTYVYGGVCIKFKEKNGVVKKARLKSNAMSYRQSYNVGPVRTELFGFAKMKGKKIDIYDLPSPVMNEFGVQPVGP